MRNLNFRNIKWTGIFYCCLSFWLSSAIPVCAQTLSKKDTSNIHFLNSRKFYIYKVDKGETLFSISQKFNIPQEEIRSFNHEIDKTGLKAKMKLWIPAYSWLKKDTVAGKENESKKSDDNIFRVAVVTALKIPMIYIDQDTSENFVDEPLKRQVIENLEFAEGILNSAEVLRSKGFKVHIYLMDSENDSVRVLRKLRKYSDYNLIITNETGSVLRQVSQFSLTKNYKLLSCGINTVEVIRTNKNALALLPSSGTQCEMAGRFSSDYFPNAQPITVKTSSPKENERSDLFGKGWLNEHSGLIKKADFVKGGNAAVTDSISKVKNNIIFVSTSNEDMVSSLLNSLKLKVADYKLTVVGLPTWQYFQSIDPVLMENCNVHLFNAGFIDYNSEIVNSFRRYFRDKFNTEPSDPAYLGYDALKVAGELFLLNGKSLVNENKTEAIKGIYSDYIFLREDSTQAFENRVIHVYQPYMEPSEDLVKKVKLY